MAKLSADFGSESTGKARANPSRRRRRTSFTFSCTSSTVICCMQTLSLQGEQVAGVGIEQQDRPVMRMAGKLGEDRAHGFDLPLARNERRRLISAIVEPRGLHLQQRPLFWIRPDGFDELVILDRDVQIRVVLDAVGKQVAAIRHLAGEAMQADASAGAAKKGKDGRRAA